MFRHDPWAEHDVLVVGDVKEWIIFLDARGREEGVGADTMNTSRKIIPIWGIVSVALTPLAPLFAALAVVIAQALVDKPEGVSRNYFPGVSRNGVLVMLACIAAGALSAVIALVRRERPRSLPVLGLVTNAFLVGMFRYFEFYSQLANVR